MQFLSLVVVEAQPVTSSELKHSQYTCSVPPSVLSKKAVREGAYKCLPLIFFPDLFFFGQGPL